MKKKNIYIKKKLFLVILAIKISLKTLIITATDLFGNVIFWSSLGKTKLRGIKKKSFYAVQQAINLVKEKLLLYKNKNIILTFSGNGSADNVITKELKFAKFNIIKIIKKYSIAFNGCRLPKKRKK